MLRMYGQTPIGVVGVTVEADAITEILLPPDVDSVAHFTDTRKSDVDCISAVAGNAARGWQEKSLDLVTMAFVQIRAYLTGERQEFTLPIRSHGTSFQCRVWAELGKIPYGTTASYGEIASRMGQPRAVRAVGAACGRNPIPLVVPCHRVVGKRGRLTGFRGGLELKQRLLELETFHRSDHME
ncbi:MAG: methylated-DNA--[protein]-cysteine S-methyltransferase [Thermoguttaceae bacterium]|nr:methylated-DNA--[protein]-cysteine S-methyltransferase [Thermoguttaceae bacterium]